LVRFASNIAQLNVVHGLYYRGDALVVLNIPELKRFILQEMPDANYSGHVGYYRTTKNMNAMYWWPSMSTEIHEYVKECKVCQQDKHLQRHPAGKLMPIAIPSEVWEHVTADRITGLPKTKNGHTAILVVVGFARLRNGILSDRSIASLRCKQIWLVSCQQTKCSFAECISLRSPNLSQRFHTLTPVRQ